MRITLSARIASLLIQYSLVISITVLPYGKPFTVRAQEKVLPAGGAATSLENETAQGRGPTAVAEKKHAAETYLHPSPGEKNVLPEIPNLAQKGDGIRQFKNAARSLEASGQQNCGS